jgi:hypothetical protein
VWLSLSMISSLNDSVTVVTWRLLPCFERDEEMNEAEGWMNW